ncbi:hypothetical protein [Actinacidiphila oryziradicis]|uniref:hypothetical protein n=1 Tax=Actinacidiphila oryziradicis TaxID=2571141 RepID=UPI001B8027F0|nr:hypothetical protein [Actinacidiphila oryziradicis]
MARPITVLFDIDETLVHTGGSGARSWAWAFDRLHGVSADIGEHSSAGETDPQVGTATFKAVLGRDRAPTRWRGCMANTCGTCPRTSGPRPATGYSTASKRPCGG